VLRSPSAALDAPFPEAGYRRVGELADYVVAGHSELLMRKTTGPLTP
jgi:hypothetical protein